VADGFFSVEGELTAAEAAHAQGRYAEAEAHLRKLLAQTRAADYEYDDWLRRLAEVYRLEGRRREAGLLYIYLHYYDLARELLPKEAAAERAHCFTLEKRWVEAAAEFAAADLPVQAAVATEEARDAARARDAWAALLGAPGLRDRPYERALVCFNLGMATQRAAERADAGGARRPLAPEVRAEVTRHLVAAQRLLEQVADEYETAGERERAFNCYQILLKLGQDSGWFENLSEGYLNCIRILKEDGFKFYVLQYYEDFLELALQREEFHAAATLYREAADYAQRAGLPYHRFYLRRSADTWWREADKAVRAGAPVELVENAYLASVDCFSLNGDFVHVREAYEKLAALDLGERKVARYQAIAARYAGAPSEEGEGLPFPPYLRQARAYGDIWFVDLVEWEHGGDPEKVAVAIVGDLRYPDSVRRRAVNLILELAAARAAGSIGPETLAAVAQGLGELQSYAALAPLERLYQHADARVRRAAVRALRYLFYKRSFSLLARGLADRDAAVREAAVEAMRGLHFPHAFDPLTRIYREHRDERVKAVALESIGRIGTLEAGELLVGVLRQEGGALRDVARRALSLFDDPEVVPILRQQLELEANPEVRRLIEDILGRLRRR
jgi:HEAT repeat protein